MTGRVHTEHSFEDSITEALLSTGYRLGRQSYYNRELGLDTSHLFEFIGATQADEFARLVAYAGNDPDLAQREFARLLAKEIDSRGTLDVLRNGVKDRGVRIRLAYFRPAHTIADDALGNYRRNRLSVTRQLRYSSRDAEKSLDLVLFVNGLPVATAELKNPLTGRTVDHAMAQYRTDREPSEPLFARRALVHFAVDPDQVFLTTRLVGARTEFLPFNQGSEGPGNSGGAGNPAARPGGSGYRTAYLWERVWQPDAWLDLLKRFLHIEPPKNGSATGRRSSPHGRRIIFPRYHQWHAVLSITAHAARHGSGHNYLVMHSAGSGKSNTIGWLAHRLSTLHGSAERGALDPDAVAAGRIEVNEPVFHKVVVITDRSVLDKQLGDTIYQFDHTPGMVHQIRGMSGSKSAEVAQALASTGSRVVVVTLQTFPYVMERVTALADKRIAIIIDEAHSSQSGDTVTTLKRVLRGMGAAEAADDVEDTEDVLTSLAASRGRHQNLSYFAFTATPKAKTLERFGVHDPGAGQNRAFHIYSMRQAIEEGFILDVLRNYITYSTYWKLATRAGEDIEVDPAKANPLLARFAFDHPGTQAMHAEIIVDHFQRHCLRRLGGRAKAMVVTRSRENAVRMYQALRKAASDLDCPDLGILVAFSGSLTVDGIEVTESKLNGISERELPEAFAYTRADDPYAKARTGGRSAAPTRTEYRILVVAEKYQTGFDQPLLTTMYVDKPLAGVAAVQTLSRLNRTHPKKSHEDLFVLDFANSTDDIQAAFKPYYEEAATTPTDPNILYDDERAVMSHQILVEQEMTEFVEAYLRGQPAPDTDPVTGRRWEKAHADLYQHTDPARKRFERLADEDPDAAEQFRKELRGYVRKYGFLSQVMAFTDPELERLYLFGKHLLNRLPHRAEAALDIGEIDLTHLRVDRTGHHDLRLDPEGQQVLPGFDDSVAGAFVDPDLAPLSEVVAAFNDRFGLGLSDADKLLIMEKWVAARDDPEVVAAALASRNEDDFELPFNERFTEIMVDRAEVDDKLTERFFAEDDFKGGMTREGRRWCYRMIRRQYNLPTN